MGTQLQTAHKVVQINILEGVLCLFCFARNAVVHFDGLQTIASNTDREMEIRNLLSGRMPVSTDVPGLSSP